MKCCIMSRKLEPLIVICHSWPRLLQLDVLWPQFVQSDVMADLILVAFEPTSSYLASTA